MSASGSVPGVATDAVSCATSSKAATVPWSGTPNGFVWSPSRGAYRQPSVLRPFGASTCKRSENVYIGTAAAHVSGVRPSGVRHGTSAPSALPAHGSGPSAAGTDAPPHIVLPASSAAAAVGAPPYEPPVIASRPASACPLWTSPPASHCASRTSQRLSSRWIQNA